MPSALQELELSFETRPFTRIRSLIYKKNERRPRERPRIPVKAPVSRPFDGPKTIENLIKRGPRGCFGSVMSGRFALILHEWTDFSIKLGGPEVEVLYACFQAQGNVINTNLVDI